MTVSQMTWLAAEVLRLRETETELRAEVSKLREAAQGLIPAVTELLSVAEKAGAFDNLIAELYPDSTKRGTRRSDGYARIDAARNQVKMWLATTRSALKDTGL